MSRASDRHVPRRARTAAILFLVYAVLVLGTAVVWQSGGGDARPIEFFRLGVRLVAVVVIATGLLRGAHWAWLLGVVFGGFWLITGVLSAAGIFAGAADTGASAGYMLLVLAAVMALAAACVLLLTREVRQAYRARS